MSFRSVRRLWSSLPLSPQERCAPRNRLSLQWRVSRRTCVLSFQFKANLRVFIPLSPLLETITVLVAVTLPPHAGDEADGVPVREPLHTLSAGLGGWPPKAARRDGAAGSAGHRSRPPHCGLCK